MKKLAIFEQKVLIITEIEVPDNATDGEIIDKAYAEYSGLSTYAGNGGTGKLIGVREENQRVEIGEELGLLNIEDVEVKENDIR